MVSDRKFGQQLYGYTPNTSGTGTHTYNTLANEYVYVASGGNFDQTSNTNETSYDVYLPEVMSYSDYYPFGMEMPYRNGGTGTRYGFNGMEKIEEYSGNESHLDFGARIYDNRIARWQSLDKFSKIFLFESNYSFCNNNPIRLIDIDGNIWVDPYLKEKEKITAKLNAPNSTLTVEQTEQLNLEIEALTVLSGRVQKLLENLKSNDPELYNYINDLKVSFTNADGVDQIKDIPVTVFVIDKSEHNANKYNWVGLTTRYNLEATGLEGIYNEEKIKVPLSAPPAKGSRYSKLFKCSIGFTITIEDSPSFADTRLANEAGDVMYVMEKNTQAIIDDKNGDIDPSKDYGKYATTGSGKYSFDVEDIYKQRKKGKESKETDKYPLADE